MDEIKYIKQLKNLLIRSLQELTKGKKSIAIAFSGGVDSVIIAKILKDIKIEALAYVVGIENCKDFENAEKAAEELGLELKKIVLTKEEIEEGMQIQAKILRKLYEANRDKIKPETPDSKLNPVSVSSNLPMLLVEKHASEQFIVSGLGADTLLGGFEKYLKLDKKGSIKEIEKQSNALIEFDYLEDVETAKHFGKEILMPFLDKDVAEFCLGLPYEMKIKDEEDNKGKERKYIIRKLAKEIGLSDELAFREKKSAQYGTGIMKIMKKIAKENKIQLNEYLRKIA